MPATRCSKKPKRQAGSSEYNGGELVSLDNFPKQASLGSSARKPLAISEICIHTHCLPLQPTKSPKHHQMELGNQHRITKMGWNLMTCCSVCLSSCKILALASCRCSCIGEGNGNPLQCSCLENPRDGGAWWAAVSGVAQSWT